MKKILSLILALVMIFSLTIPASASNSDLLAKLQALLKDSTLSYTHPGSGAVLQVPALWDTEEKDSSMVIFTDTAGNSVLMTMQAVYAGDTKLSKADLAKTIGAKAGNLKTVTLGSYKYSTAQVKKSQTIQNKKVTVTINGWVTQEEGYVYVYRFADTKKNELYDYFTRMIASASYGGSTANEDASPSWLGGSYSGESSGGRPQGQGTLSWGTSRYEGNFENGYPSGSGTFYFYDCSSKTGSSWGWTTNAYMSWLPDRQGADMYYTGLTLDGRPWGYGSLDFCSGGTFEGEFQYGDPHGKGVYTYFYPSSEKSSTKAGNEWITVCAENRLKNEYHGLKLDGKWQGFGIGILKSGYAYCGEIKNDYRDGYGELYTKKDAMERHGLYKKGEYVKKVDGPN